MEEETERMYEPWSLEDTKEQKPPNPAGLTHV